MAYPRFRLTDKQLEAAERACQACCTLSNTNSFVLIEQVVTREDLESVVEAQAKMRVEIERRAYPDNPWKRHD